MDYLPLQFSEHPIEASRILPQPLGVRLSTLRDDIRTLDDWIRFNDPSLLADPEADALRKLLSACVMLVDYGAPLLLGQEISVTDV